MYRGAPIGWLAFAAIAARATVASACSTPAPQPNLDWGAPLDGATDVPTDVVLLYALPVEHVGQGAPIPGTFTLQDEAGVGLPFTGRRTHAMAFEILPTMRLAPNATYTFHVSWAIASGRVEDQVQFTTGAGPLETEPAPIEGALEHYHNPIEQPNSCAQPEFGTCISFAGDDDVVLEYAYVDSFDQVGTEDAQLVAAPFFVNLSGHDQGTNFECVELRVRAANGAFGAPTRLCGADYPLREVDGAPELACTRTGLTWPGMPGELPSGQPTAGGPAAGAPADAGSAAGAPADAGSAAGAPARSPIEREPTDAQARSDSGCDCSTVRPAGHAAAALLLPALLAACRLLRSRRNARR